jgi:colanic acid/amylovoran biosynthesis glycosyltransferase
MDLKKYRFGNSVLLKSSKGKGVKSIALVVPSFPKLSETFIVSKFLGLLEWGWDVHVICHQSDPREGEQFPNLRKQSDWRQRVHVSWPPRPRWLAALLMPLALLGAVVQNPAGIVRYLRRGWKRFGLDVLRQLYFDIELLKLRPDLIHFEFGALAIGRMHLPELLDCKVTVSFRGYDLNFVGLERPGYYKKVWEKADAVHLLGEDLWKRAQKRGCGPGKPHALIPPAINLEVFDPGRKLHAEVTGSPGRPLRILSVGRLEWKKGYEYALQAVQVLVSQGISCEYLIIGGGNYLGAVAFARHQMGLDNVVHLLGPLPPRTVKEKMLWADVFLHAAVSEGFCNAVIEAQAMRLPVVCSDADGLAENVADGQTGFVAPRRDPEAMAAKLKLLAADYALRQRLGEAGRQRVSNCFQLADQIEAFERFYAQVLN